MRGSARGPLRTGSLDRVRDADARLEFLGGGLRAPSQQPPGLRQSPGPLRTGSLDRVGDADARLEFLGGGLRPPSEASPQESVAPAKPALGRRDDLVRAPSQQLPGLRQSP